MTKDELDQKIQDIWIGTSGVKINAPEIQQTRQLIREVIAAVAPERLEGEPLNLSVQATAILGNPEATSIAQGEGWDFAVSRVEAASKELLGE